MGRPVKPAKYGPLINEVQLFKSNPKHANLRFPDGQEGTVVIHHLPPSGQILELTVVGHSETGKAPDPSVEH